jgi:hypothetical protein
MIYIELFFIFSLLLFIFWIGSHLYSSIFYVPYVNASSKAIIDALEFAGLKKDEILIDLGSGRGDALIIANKKIGAKSFGWEISPFPYLISKAKTTTNKNIKIYYGNFKNGEKMLKEADVVYLYLLNSVLKNIEDWLFASISAKTRVVTMSFKFSKHSPIATKKIKNLGIDSNIFLYKK